MRISDWSSDVCSSDLRRVQRVAAVVQNVDALDPVFAGEGVDDDLRGSGAVGIVVERPALAGLAVPMDLRRLVKAGGGQGDARHVGRLDEVGEDDLLIADAHEARQEPTGRASCRESGWQYV